MSCLFHFMRSLPILMALAVAPAPALAQELPTVQLRAGMHLIRAEVAADYETRGRGLMHRKSLAPNAGMVFRFDQPSIQCMWMKNTLIPLSVAFLDEKGTVINIADMQPHSEQSHCSLQPALYALEMTRGWFAERGIKAGSRLAGLEKLR